MPQDELLAPMFRQMSIEWGSRGAMANLGTLQQQAIQPRNGMCHGY